MNKEVKHITSLKNIVDITAHHDVVILLSKHFCLSL